MGGGLRADGAVWRAGDRFPPETGRHTMRSPVATALAIAVGIILLIGYSSFYYTRLCMDSKLKCYKKKYCKKCFNHHLIQTVKILIS